MGLGETSEAGRGQLCWGDPGSVHPDRHSPLPARTCQAVRAERAQFLHHSTNHGGRSPRGMSRGMFLYKSGQFLARDNPFAVFRPLITPYLPQ